MSNANLDATKKLELTRLKKYWTCADQVKIELDWLQDWIPAFATYLKHLPKVYDNEEVIQNMSVGRDIDPE